MKIDRRNLTIVDQFIADNYQVLSDSQMAKQLGIRASQVATHKFELGLLRLDQELSELPSMAEITAEMDALIYFINERKTGLFVQIAKDRLEQLQGIVTD